jgi:uroporphyrinogen-III synthase
VKQTGDNLRPVLLDGFTVGITADRRWEEQAALFQRRGAAVQHGPVIRTLPLGADDRLRAVTEAIASGPPAFLVANTGIGMRSWFAAAESWDLEDDLHAALAGTAVYARGPKASAAVHAHGLEVVARGRSERLAEVVEMVLDAARPGDSVAVQLDGGPDPPVLDRLRAAGIEVVEVPVYEWRLPGDPRPAVRLAEGVIAGRVHAVTFTAGVQVGNWLSIVAEDDLDAALLDALAAGDVVVGCVGPVCADAAVTAGLPRARLVVPAVYRLGPLVRAVTDALVRRTATVRLRRAELSLAGTVVRVGDLRAELTGTEARLLATLAARPGTVMAKEELLRAVWGEAAGDTHVVEVTVGRLRRRLGAHGDAITAVPKRGYALR